MNQNNWLSLVAVACLLAQPALAQQAITNTYLQSCSDSVSTQYTHSPDGTRIAFDASGRGPTIMLLHGGGQSRKDWHDAGYIERLKDRYRLIAMDIRGNGDSDKPIEPAAYTTEKLGQDILAVADACGAQQFVIWGFSYGGNIARYLAAQSERVAGLVIVGIPFGAGASGAFRESIERMREHWVPILQAQQNGTLDEDALAAEDRGALRAGNMPLALAWLSAMLDWDTNSPEDLLAPALWLVGSENADAMASLKEYENTLPSTRVLPQVVQGLTHLQEFTETEAVLPLLTSFTDSLPRK
jgi:pimeloyl-ACP methyl ester carboxylesterase